MPKITIDNITITVPDGTTVLEAAQAVGIHIPHFCWHPALGKAGACRVCAVKILEGPIKGIQMSCMLPAQDGMVVSTTDTEAQEMRRHVIEWLMINHPHDCPVCDEGGECLLQDFTVAGGHGIRRYTGKKRTHVNQNLGPYIQHEMNRCIQCYRCARFYQEFAGGTDFGVMGSAARVYFGRFTDGPLESPFSGNLVDICPTGVFTDKTARFRARYWDYDMAPSVCPHCSLGCNTTPVARYRELLKITARRNDAVNGWFICDRGRFTNAAVNDPQRLRTPLVDGRETTWDEALDALLTRVSEIGELYGPESVAVVGSPRLAQEGNLLAAQFAQIVGAGALCYFTDVLHADRTLTAVAQLTKDNAASMADVQRSDCIAIAECNLLEEGPMLALAVRQAWRNGARVYVVGSECPGEAVKELPFDWTGVATLAEVPFAEVKNPVVICGTAHKNLTIIEEAACCGAKVAYLLTGPNAFGAALLSQEPSTVSLSEAMAGGTIKAVIAWEADIPSELLASVPLVVVADWLPTEASRAAHIALPTTAWVEMDGTYINFEGRAQRFKQVMRPGLPIKGLDPAVHPPRVHSKEAPGGNVRPAWRIIADLVGRLGEPAVRPFTGLWECLRDLNAEVDGIKICHRDTETQRKP